MRLLNSFVLSFRTIVFAARALACEDFQTFSARSRFFWLCVRQGNVLGKRVLCRDGLADSVWHDGVVVDTAGELIEAQAIASEVIFKGRQVQGIKIADRCYANCLHASFCDLSYSRNAAHHRCCRRG